MQRKRAILSTGCRWGQTSRPLPSSLGTRLRINNSARVCECGIDASSNPFSYWDEWVGLTTLIARRHKPRTSKPQGIPARPTRRPSPSPRALVRVLQHRKGPQSTIPTHKQSIYLPDIEAPSGWVWRTSNTGCRYQKQPGILYSIF